MAEQHDSWLKSTFGVDVDDLKAKAAAVVDTVKQDVQSAENFAKQTYDAGKAYVENKVDEAKQYVENKVDDAKKEVASVKQTVMGDESGKPVPRPMEGDCKPEHGKVPGPKNHIYCATHGHVLDTDTKQIIASSVADYVKRGVAKAVSQIDPAALTDDIGRSGPLNSPSYVNNPNPPAALTGGPNASAGDSYFVTGGQKGELLDRLKGLYEVGNQMNEMAKMLEKSGHGMLWDDKNVLASAKNLTGAAKATLTLASEIDKWTGSENAASIQKGSDAVGYASKLIQAVETISKLRDSHIALEKMAEKPNQQSVEAWADSVGDAFATAGSIIPTSGLPGFMGDYYKGLFNAPKNYISAFKTLMHVHYDNIDTEAGLTSETLLRGATLKAEDLGKTGLDWSGDLTPVFMGGWTLPKMADGTEFQRYMVNHHKIGGTDLLKSTVNIGVALLMSQIQTDLADDDPAKQAWLGYLGQSH